MGALLLYRVTVHGQTCHVCAAQFTRWFLAVRWVRARSILREA